MTITTQTTTQRIQTSASEAWSKTQTSTGEAWAKTKASSKDWFTNVGDPALCKATNKIGESDKAARIIRSFCIDGSAVKDIKDTAQEDWHNLPEVRLMKIPAEVIRNCRGLAIFTVVRAGFLSTRSGGSGIIIAKQSDGKWSPPSGIIITALGGALQAGADIYDCICVINNEDGMEGFTTAQLTVGAEVGVAAGPLGGGAQVTSEVHKRQAPVLTYTKGRGLYMGVQVKGPVIVERTSENERFYGVEGVKNTSILAGMVQPPDGMVDQLWETLKAAQRDPHDESKLPPARNAPDDQELEVAEEKSQNE